VRRNHPIEAKTRSVEQRAVLVGGALAPGEHHQHVEIHQLSKRRAAVGGDDHLDDQHFGTAGGAGAALLQNLASLRVIPIVENRFEQVNVGRRHALEKVAGNQLVSTSEPAGGEDRPCFLDGVRQVEQNASGARDLIARKLGMLAFGVYGSRDYFQRRGRPRSVDDLAGHDLIGYDRETTPNVGSRWLDQTAQGLRTVLRCDHILAVRAAALAGYGIAVFPCFLASDVPALERVGAPVSSHEIWLVQHPDLQRTARIRAVAELIVEVCERNGKELRGEPATSSPAEAPRYSRRDPATKRRVQARSRR